MPKNAQNLETLPKRLLRLMVKDESVRILDRISVLPNLEDDQLMMRWLMVDS